MALRPLSIAPTMLLGPTSSPTARHATSPQGGYFDVGSTSLLQLLSGARRWKGRGMHRRGGARAQPVRLKPKRRRYPEGKVKLKTHKGAMKRFWQKGDGTFMHKAAGKKHLQAGTSRSRQTLRKMAHRPVTTKGIIKKLRRLMPYGSTTMPAPRHTVSRLWERPDNWRETVQAAVLAVRAATEGKRKKKAGAKSP